VLDPYDCHCEIMLLNALVSASAITESVMTDDGSQQHALLTLVQALVISNVDYCYSVLAGISGQWSTSG